MKALDLTTLYADSQLRIAMNFNATLICSCET